MLLSSTIELPILNALQSIRSPELDTIVSTYSALGNFGICWIVLALVFVLRPFRRRLGLEIGLALFFHLLSVNLLLKPLIDRARPCDIEPLTDPLLTCLTDGSFPSGHTGAAFATAGVFLLHRHPAAPWLLLAAVFMGLSRLYLFVHFPSDVLAGALWGLFLAYVAHRTVECFASRRQ